MHRWSGARGYRCPSFGKPVSSHPYLECNVLTSGVCWYTSQAFFPRFPSSSSDNLFHLQALRHMYALAVKEKELRAVDIDTKESVFVTIEVSHAFLLV